MSDEYHLMSLFKNKLTEPERKKAEKLLTSSIMEARGQTMQKFVEAFNARFDQDIKGVEWTPGRNFDEIREEILDRIGNIMDEG